MVKYIEGFPDHLAYSQKKLEKCQILTFFWEVFINLNHFYHVFVSKPVYG